MSLDFELETLNLVTAHRAGADMTAADLAPAKWDAATPARLTRYWSGEPAPGGRHAEARVMWSQAALHVRFVCRRMEPLVVSATPQTERKAIGLWERDVCEIFVAPDARQPERYFEFEAAPTGEWLDLAIYHSPHGRETDWEFDSGMTAAAHVGASEMTIAMRVPWDAFGRAPQSGERWRANLFRCVGAGEERGYIAWQPTYAAQPDFHVPQAFGWLEFKG